MKLERGKKFFTVILNISFILVLSIFTFGYWEDRQMMVNYTQPVFYLVVGLIVVQLLSFWLSRVRFYDFSFIFTTVSYLFMFGGLFNKVFSLKTTLLWNPVSYFTDETLYHSYLFIIWCLEIFTFIYVLTLDRESISKQWDSSLMVRDEEMLNTGTILVVIGGLSRLVTDFQIIRAVSSRNSYAAYSSAINSGIIDDLAFFLLVGVFFIYFSGCLSNRQKRWIFYGLLSYFMMMMVLTGSRKVQLFYIIALGLGYLVNTNKRLSLWQLISYGILGYVLLTIIIVIRNYRFDLSSVLGHIVEQLLDFTSIKDFAGDIFSETGLTSLSVASAIQTVPSPLGFQYGLSFLRSLLTTLPIGWLAGDLINLASPTIVINALTGVPVGASLIEEMYWNFGYIGGVIGMGVLGAFCSRFLKYHPRLSQRQQALYFSLISILLVLVRSSFLDIYRSIIYLFVGIFLLRRVRIYVK